MQHPSNANRIWLLLRPSIEIKAPSQPLASVDGGQTWTIQALPVEYVFPRLTTISADGRYLFGTATGQGLVRARLASGHSAVARTRAGPPAASERAVLTAAVSPRAAAP